jgi:hypothetical protein
MKDEIVGQLIKQKNTFKNQIVCQVNLKIQSALLHSE